MTLAIAVIAGIAGIVAIVGGLGFYVMFRIGLKIFDRALRTEVAAYGRDQVERAAMQIRNPIVRRVISQYVVGAGGAVAVSVVRGAIQSRMQTGLMVAALGLIVLIAAFYTDSWLPLIFRWT